ncbi:MAG: porin, partial [Pseudomonadota bacterium]
MARSLTTLMGLATACAAWTSAFAADPVEFDVEGEASVVAGVSDGDDAADADAEIRFRGTTVFSNGVELGAVVSARLDGQQPAQIFAGGRYSSLLIGGPRGVGPLTSDAYIQGAYAFARGGFGEVILGRNEGVARTLAVTAPTIFRAINVNDWRTDLSGINDVHTVNDFSGYATKISYLPPANFLGGVLGGLQLGVSYSPTLRECGERLCAPENGFIIAPDGTLLSESSNWEDVVEAALYYQKRLNNDLLLGFGASYVSADEDARSISPIFEDYESMSLGLNVAFRGVTLGGSVKSTNAGLTSFENDDDGYLAFDAGVTFKTGEDKGDLGFMFGYGQSEASVFGPNPLDPELFRDTQTVQAGV